MYGLFWFGMVCWVYYYIEWYGRYGMVWFGMVWYGLVWCGIFS